MMQFDIFAHLFEVENTVYTYFISESSPKNMSDCVGVCLVRNWLIWFWELSSLKSVGRLAGWKLRQELMLQCYYHLEAEFLLLWEISVLLHKSFILTMICIFAIVIFWQNKKDIKMSTRECISPKMSIRKKQWEYEHKLLFWCQLHL